ncbi:disulfide bond formation protein B [Sneathiella aquimaris]|uniref:disulfide bond formation protein B n=1 Tax=Sneathiella aquimaris TaxID=2599305 RepID=UPI00146F4B81|nr:disulfide bond formation protein B [Sneathiella aquimaris]
MIALYLKSLHIALLASVGALATAFVAQFAFGLHPCVLCLYQRWPYAAVIVVSGAGLLVSRKFGFRGVFDALAALGFFATSAIGAFHVGVEQGWWEGFDGCVADTSVTSSMAELRSQIMSAPVVKCDEIAWELFGVSMAGYNTLFAALLMIFMIKAFFNNRA